MSATPKNDIVRLRLTTMEREAWSRAAGGKGKLSDWIRATCNASALTEGEPDGPRPIVVEGTDSSAVSAETPVDRAVARFVDYQCARWQHHRKGVYCGSCKRVQ